METVMDMAGAAARDWAKPRPGDAEKIKAIMVRAIGIAVLRDSEVI